MHTIARKRDESLVIAEDVVVTVVDISANKVRLRIDAPSDLPCCLGEDFRNNPSRSVRTNFRRALNLLDGMRTSIKDATPYLREEDIIEVILDLVRIRLNEIAAATSVSELKNLLFCPSRIDETTDLEKGDMA